MKKEDLISYLKILCSLLLIFPLVHAFFMLDFGFVKGGLIAVGVYIILMLIAIPMFNYLEYGIFWYWVGNKRKNSSYEYERSSR